MPLRPSILALFVLTVVAAGLRTIALDQSLWLDELHTAWTVAGSWSDVASRAMQGNQSPLYYLAVYAVREVLGDGEIALRLPSLAAGVAIVPLMFAAVRRFTASNSAGLLAAALVVIDHDCLFYAQEARPYAWVQLVGLGHILIFDRLLATGRTGLRALFIGGGLLLFYLHYTAVLLVVVELTAYALLSFRSATRPVYRPTSLLMDVAAIGLGCLPMSGHLAEIAARREQWKPYVPTPSWLGLLTQFRGDVLILLPAVFVGLCAAADRLAPSRLRRGKRPLVVPPPDSATLVVVWALLPRLLAAAVTFAGWLSLALGRYIIVSAVAPVVFAAGCWSMLTSRRARAVLTVVLLAMAVYRGGLWAQYRHDGRLVGDRREDWASAVEYLNDAAGPHDLVFLCGGLLEDSTLRDPSEGGANARTEYCRFPVSGLYRLRDDLIVRPLPTRGSQRMQPADLGALMQRPRAWCLVRGDDRLVDAVIDDVLRQLAARRRAARVTRRKALDHLTVVRFELLPEHAGPSSDK